MLLGGEPFDEQLVMWWNFVGRDHEEVAEARAAWEARDAQERPGASAGARATTARRSRRRRCRSPGWCPAAASADVRSPPPGHPRFAARSSPPPPRPPSPSRSRLGRPLLGRSLLVAVWRDLLLSIGVGYPSLGRIASRGGACRVVGGRRQDGPTRGGTLRGSSVTSRGGEIRALRTCPLTRSPSVAVLSKSAEGIRPGRERQFAQGLDIRAHFGRGMVRTAPGRFGADCRGRHSELSSPNLASVTLRGMNRRAV